MAGARSRRASSCSSSPRCCSAHAAGEVPHPAERGEVRPSGPRRTETLAVGEAVPDFMAPRLGGGVVGWRARNGALSVLVVWASRCPHGERLLPLLVRVAPKYPAVRAPSPSRTTAGACVRRFPFGVGVDTLTRYTMSGYVAAWWRSRASPTPLWNASSWRGESRREPVGRRSQASPPESWTCWTMREHWATSVAPGQPARGLARRLGWLP